MNATEYEKRQVGTETSVHFLKNPEWLCGHEL